MRPHLLTALLLLVLTASALGSCSSSDNSSAPTNASSSAGTTVQVSASATDPNGDPLHYMWAATEGTIDNVDAPNTTWTIPAGSGLQFAYVLVSDNKGGYAESRAAALTFSGVAESSSTTITPPSSQPVPGFAWGEFFYQRTASSRRVYLPDVSIQLTVNSKSITTTTDLKGEFFVPNLPFGSYNATYTLPSGQTGNFTINVTQGSLPTSPSAPAYIRQSVTGGALRITGHVSLVDGSLCGIRNEFFTHSKNPNLLRRPESAKVELLQVTNSSFSSLAGPVSVNHYGDFFLTRGQIVSTDVRLRVSCGQPPDQIVIPNNVPLSGDSPPQAITIKSLFKPTADNARPNINSMSVTLGGREVGRPDLPKATTLLPEMELAPGDDAFLTYKGIDTRKGACAYYYQIGAVEGCDGDGFPTGAQLTLDQWRNNHNLSPFHNGNPAEPEFKAIYINKQDLNLTRDMQAIKLQDGTLAYNVCNYPGPQDATDPLASPKLIGEETQPDIDLAIDNAKRGIGKVVCVAMDYTPTEGVRFYTFSPSGRLLLSVSLDGRREKFMPGACVACHGGDNYGGKFPDNYTSLKKGDLGPGQANLGSYFLPFDVANFYFSSTDPSLKPAVLFAPLRQMNQLLTQVPTPQIKPIADDLLTLINGWYPANNNDDKQSRPAPPIYSDQSNNQPQGTRQCGDCHGSTVVENYDARRLHKAVIASNCQICHTSNASVHDPRAGGEPRITFIQRPPAHYLTTTSRGLSIIAPPPAPQVICGGSADLKKNHTMPNALGSFERFWRQPVKAKDLDLPAWLFAFPPLSDSILDVNLRDLDLNQEPTPVSQPGLQEGGCANLSARPAL